MDQQNAITAPTLTNVNVLSTESMLSPTRSCNQNQLKTHACRHGKRCCLTPQRSHRSIARAVRIATEDASGIPLSFSDCAGDESESAMNGSELSSKSQLLTFESNTTQDDEHRQSGVQTPSMHSKKAVCFDQEVCVLCDEHELCECVVQLCVDPKSPTSDVELSPPESQTPPPSQSSSEQQPLKTQQLTQQTQPQQMSSTQSPLIEQASRSLTNKFNTNLSRNEICTSRSCSRDNENREPKGRARRLTGGFRAADNVSSCGDNAEADNAYVQCLKSKPTESSSGSFKPHLPTSTINIGGASVSNNMKCYKRGVLWLAGDSSLSTGHSCVETSSTIAKDECTSNSVSDICSSAQHSSPSSLVDQQNGLSIHKLPVASRSESEGCSARRYKRGYEWLRGFSSSSDSLGV